MANDSLARERMTLDQLDQRLSNMSLRQQCSTPVCVNLRVSDVCTSTQQKNCLVPYPYGLTLGETYKVAQQAKFEQRLAAQSSTRSSAAFDEAIDVANGPESLPPFKPDWRFWTGITCAGLGLFLHRSR